MHRQGQQTTNHKLKTKNSLRVFVGLSGGVDSSVSAALLKKAGNDVTGVFIRVWQPGDDDSPSTRKARSGQLQAACNWKEDRLDAMRVCAKLGIPFRDLDLTKEYKTEVVDYMVREYKAGRTPNPDVMCNRHVKFGGFFDWAMKEGADYVATGHYARVGTREVQISKSQVPNKFDIQNSKFQLHASIDTNKDQTYFLWTLTQRQLSHTLFPVGGMTKPDVRKLAKKFDLPTAEKKDSQGLCFIGKIDVKEFLKHFIKPKRGAVLDESGKKIGWHDGATFLTLGEHHGFTITEKTPSDKTRFVIAKDIKKNTVTVSTKNIAGETSGRVKKVSISSVNWISAAPAAGAAYLGRFRYRAPLVPCSLNKLGKSWQVNFQTPQNFVTPGQSLVIYSKNGECFGGGIIT